MMNFHKYPNVYPNKLILKVADLEKACLFYKEIIGFQVEQIEEKRVALFVGNNKPFLFLEELESVEKKERTAGLYHFAILVPSRKALGVILKHLVESGYPLQGAADHDVSEAIYLADPDGNGIEIYHDRKAEDWKWDAKNQVEMRTYQMDAEGVLEAGENQAWNGLPDGTILGHIHLHVAELNETVDFYVKGLGFDVVQKYGSQAYFLSTGKYHHHIGLNIWNGVGAPPAKEKQVGLKSFHLMVPSLNYLEKIKENLDTIEIFYEEKGGILITADPSGNKITLSVEKEK